MHICVYVNACLHKYISLCVCACVCVCATSTTCLLLNRTCLHWVCDRGKLQTLDYLLHACCTGRPAGSSSDGTDDAMSNTIDINARTKHDDTALLWAVKANVWSAVKMMLDFSLESVPSSLSSPADGGAQERRGVQLDILCRNNRGENAIDLCKDNDTKGLLLCARDRAQQRAQTTGYFGGADDIGQTANDDGGNDDDDGDKVPERSGNEADTEEDAEEQPRAFSAYKAKARPAHDGTRSGDPTTNANATTGVIPSSGSHDASGSAPKKKLKIKLRK